LNPFLDLVNGDGPHRHTTAQYSEYLAVPVNMRFWCVEKTLFDILQSGQNQAGTLPLISVRVGAVLAEGPVATEGDPVVKTSLEAQLLFGWEFLFPVWVSESGVALCRWNLRLHLLVALLKIIKWESHLLINL